MSRQNRASGRYHFPACTCITCISGMHVGLHPPLPSFFFSLAVACCDLIRCIAPVSSLHHQQSLAERSEARAHLYIAMLRFVPFCYASFHTTPLRDVRALSRIASLAPRGRPWLRCKGERGRSWWVLHVIYPVARSQPLEAASQEGATVLHGYCEEPAVFSCAGCCST